MIEVFRGYRQKIKAIELDAGAEIERIMTKPTLSQANMKAMNDAVVKMAMDKAMAALKEGVRFGRYIKTKT